MKYRIKQTTDQIYYTQYLQESDDGMTWVNVWKGKGFWKSEMYFATIEEARQAAQEHFDNEPIRNPILEEFSIEQKSK